MSASQRHDKNQNYNVDEGLEAFPFPVEADIYILTSILLLQTGERGRAFH